MKYTLPSLTFFLLVLSYQHTIAEPITHSHKERSHTHLLPKTGLDHSHIPKPHTPPENNTKQKFKHDIQAHEKKTNILEKTLPREVIVTPPAPKRLGWKAIPVLVGKLHPSTLQVLCSKHGEEYNPSISDLNIKGKIVASWVCQKPIAPNKSSGPMINKNATCKLQWPTSNFFIGTPSKGYEHTWQCMKWVWQRSTPSSPTTSERLCNVKVTLSSEKNFTGMMLTGSRGEGKPVPVKIKAIYILLASSKKTVITQSINLDKKSVARVTDHRTGERYKTVSYTFERIFEGNYIVTLGGLWMTEPRSIPFSCPNARGKYDFNLPRLKHIRINQEG